MVNKGLLKVLFASAEIRDPELQKMIEYLISCNPRKVEFTRVPAHQVAAVDDGSAVRLEAELDKGRVIAFVTFTSDKKPG